MGTGANAANMVANYTATIAAASSVTVDLYEGLYPMAGSGNVRVTKIKVIYACIYVSSSGDSTTVPMLVKPLITSGWSQSGTTAVNSPFVNTNCTMNLGVNEPWIAVNSAGFEVSNTRKNLLFSNTRAGAISRVLEVYVIGEGLASY